MVRAVESGHDPIEVLQSAAAVADTIEDNGKAKDFGLVPASQFIAASHQVNYLVDGMVAEGQSLLIAAAEKCFKTTLAVDLVTSITTGERFLGQFDVLKKTPVLMFSGESGDAKLTQTLRAVCAAKGIDYSDLRDLIITTELPQLGNAADIIALRRQIKRHNAGMIVLDPAYLCMDIAVPGRWTSMRGQARRTIRRNGTSPYRDQATPYVALRKARGSSSDAGRMSASSR
jgi:RecA-family ATPase